jgi:hypothetical protein
MINLTSKTVQAWFYEEEKGKPYLSFICDNEEEAAEVIFNLAIEKFGDAMTEEQYSKFEDMFYYQLKRYHVEDAKSAVCRKIDELSERLEILEEDPMFNRNPFDKCETQKNSTND